MMASSASPDRRAVSRYSRWPASSARLIEQRHHPEHAVHRRADLVAHGGQEAALGRRRLLGLAPRLVELPLFHASCSVSRRKRDAQKLHTATWNSAMPKWKNSFQKPTGPSKKFISTPAFSRIGEGDVLRDDQEGAEPRGPPVLVGDQHRGAEKKKKCISGRPCSW